MKLFLLRHGIAVDPGTSGIHKDSDRFLTPEGETEMASVTRAMEKLELSWDVILSSPYVRARQTAEIVAKNIDLKKYLKFSPHLASEGDPQKLIEEIRSEYSRARSILLVGHEPYMSGLISMLVTGRADSDVTMKKGGLCKLSLADLQYKKCACLEWLLTPKQLCAMVRS